MKDSYHGFVFMYNAVLRFVYVPSQILYVTYIYYIHKLKHSKIVLAITSVTHTSIKPKNSSQSLSIPLLNSRYIFVHPSKLLYLTRDEVGIYVYLLAY